MNLSPLQQARYAYTPKLPGMLRGGISEISVKVGAPTESVAWASPDEVSVQGPEFETVWVPSGLSVLPGRKTA